MARRLRPGVRLRSHVDQLYSIGGETGGAVVEGEFSGHHPDLCLKGGIHGIK